MNLNFEDAFPHVGGGLDPLPWDQGVVPTSLDTPSIPVEMTEPFWPDLENLEGAPSGLFDTKSEDATPDPVSLLTPEPVLDIGDMDLGTLDAEDVEKILLDTDPSFASSSTDNPCLSDSQSQSSYQQGSCSDFSLRALSHDHDYCDKSAEDWSILSEFLIQLEPCQSALDRQGSISSEGMDKVIRTTLMEMDSESASGFLLSDPSFMDTRTNLEPFLTGESSSRFQQEEDSSIVGLISLEEQAESESEKKDDDSSLRFLVQEAKLEKASSARSLLGRQTTSNGKNFKYLERRQKNNIASQQSRKTRKQKRIDLEYECVDLGTRNAHLRTEIQALEALTKDWKDRLLKTFAAR